MLAKIFSLGQSRLAHEERVLQDRLFSRTPVITREVVTLLETTKQITESLTDKLTAAENVLNFLQGKTEGELTDMEQRLLAIDIEHAPEELLLQKTELLTQIKELRQQLKSQK